MGFRDGAGNRSRGRDSGVAGNCPKPAGQIRRGFAVILVIVANAFKNGAVLAISTLAAFHPTRVLDHRLSGRGDRGDTFRTVKVLDGLEGVTVFSNAQPAPDDLVEVDEHLVSEKVIHSILTSVMERAQPSNRADFVGCIVKNMHARIGFPPIEDPIQEALERELFPGTIMGSPVVELQ